MIAKPILPQRRLTHPLLRATAVVTLLTVGFAQVVLAQATATKMQTVAVVALNSYDDLMGDIGYVGGLFGRPQTGQMIEGMVAMFTQGRGLVGLDKTRPFGIVVAVDGSEVTPVGCLPIDDLDSILEVVQGFGIIPADAGDGITELELPDQTLYLKPQGGWVYLADKPEALDATPDDPTELLESVASQYDLGAKAMFQNVPDEARDELVGALKEGMEMGLQQKPNESDEQHELRVKLAELQVGQITDIMEGLDEVSVGLNFDADGKVTLIDAAMTAIPGSMVHSAFKSYDNLETTKRGFHRQDAAMSLLSAGSSVPEVIEMQREQLETMIGMFRKQIDQAIDEQDEVELSEEQRDILKSAGSDLMDVYESMVYGGKTDMGGSLDFIDGQLSAIVGLYIEKTDKLESALKKLVTVLEDQPNFPGIEWDADSLGDITMHRLAIPLPPQAMMLADLLGEQLEVTVGLGPKSFYLAAGPKGVEDLKAAINKSKSTAGPLEQPGEVIFSLAKFLKIAQPYIPPQGAPFVNMLLGTFDELDADADKITFKVIRIEDGARFRYEINEGILKAIGNVVNQIQAMQAQGGGGF